jgi:glutamine synthetase
MQLPDAESFLADGNYKYVRFEQTDLHGLSRSKTIPVAHFGHFSEEGLNFFGGLLGLDLQSGVASGTGYMDERKFADHRIRPDLSTLAPVPWVDDTARVICEPYWYDGEPAKAAPRFLLRQMLEKLDSMGYALKSGFEYEFYLVTQVTQEPVFDGIQIFWTLRNNFDGIFIDYVLSSLNAAGLDVITSNAEYGPGQMEINFAPAEAEKGADQAFVFKNAVKEMAQERGYVASFMTRPFADQSSSGCHFHHSLLDRRSGENVFHDATDPDGLSELARHWIAGQIEHAPALTALVAPTINCAKRYKLFSFAPMNAAWGLEDRTAAIRIKGGPAAETHVENRTPGAGSNPYLVAAALLAAGIDGLTRGLEPPPPTQQIAYLDESATPLPNNLDDALTALEADTALHQFLGDEFIQLFLAVKNHEIAKARDALPEYGTPEWPSVVTEWERQNMLEYL